MPRMTGQQCFAEMVRGYGVSHVFFVPTIMTPALAFLGELGGVTRVMTHGEKAAAYMADGYARARRRPGLVMAQTVGAANLAAGLKDAFMACSPVVALSGGPLPQYRYRYAYQEIDDFPMFGPVTKWSARVDSVERLPDLLRQAFRVATTGAPGPAHLEVPGEQGQGMDASGELEPLVEPTFSQVPAFRPEPPREQLEAVARVLAAAARPVIVAGGGVHASQAGPELTRLAEQLGIPVVSSLNGKSAIPDDHPLAVGVLGTYSRSCANRLVDEADLVFFVGSRAGGQVTHFWRFPRPGTPVVQLDIDPRELGRNYPNQASILGDAKVALARLVELAGQGPRRQDWLARAEQLVGEWRAEHAEQAVSDAAPLRPERLVRELSEWLPAETVVVSDTGHAGMWTGQMLNLTRPGQRYLRAAGSLGWGLPAALGAKCALPDQPVLCFTGDGGLYYHLAELETAARYGINAVILVNNNLSMNQEIRPFNLAYNQAFGDVQHEGFEMWQFAKQLDLAKTAEGLGCLARRVERPAELRPALEWAFAANRPVLLDVLSDPLACAPRPWTG